MPVKRPLDQIVKTTVLSEGQKVNFEAKKQHRKFLRKIISLRKNKTSKGQTLQLEDLVEHFQNMYSNDSDSLPTENDDVPLNGIIFYPDLDSDVSLKELKRATFHQKNNSSYSLDNVCSEAIKSSFDLISDYLLNIVNHISNTGEYPDSWGHGIIAPILKSGDPNLAKNYRGITISNILSKIYSQILLNRFNKWAEIYEVLSKNQFGFQKGKSTIDFIFILHSIISNVLNSKLKLHCVFIDVEKAFDKIDRITLWQKLILENISSKIVRALKKQCTQLSKLV